jgi:hypothetical protein
VVGVGYGGGGGVKRGKKIANHLNMLRILRASVIHAKSQLMDVEGKGREGGAWEGRRR